ncbi:hypothetical protein N7489_010204 [Penicillium chrysogenum]|uniref:uncharacterized protein n=1 Tax=Penicillium chrysogenum TaxID=5076 RepID=UPI002398D83F|nr:uncharacterized protein N7489_010204 [Penicillium chrysogenum]KAJ5229496.1 hypothetical protein N7489_010204 [Penicillium chrysogenum]KAJ5258900.1 hypothetical protein N7524_010456 [Penicillium chrysogenum]
MTFRTLVQVPSVLPTPPPSAVPSTPSAINNLAKLPAPLWGVILVVVTFPCGEKKKKKGKKPEEGAEAPAKTEGTPLDDRTTAILSPQEALTKDWLRAREAGDNSRPLRVLVEAEGPNIALPAADEGVRFVPVPPGYVLPASRRPASPSRQPLAYEARPRQRRSPRDLLPDRRARRQGVGQLTKLNMKGSSVDGVPLLF